MSGDVHVRICESLGVKFPRANHPLPGILPLFSLKQMVRHGYIKEPEAEVLSAVRYHNHLLFDFVLKRTLRVDQKGFSTAPFQTRKFFLSGSG